MIFRQLFEPVSSTYTYLLGCEETGLAVLVDPVIETCQRDVETLKSLGLILAYTLETHLHADHLTGARKLKVMTGSKIAAPEMDGLECVDTGIAEGRPFQVGSLIFHPLYTPGHTDTHHAYVVEWDGAIRLFSGDALLIDGCGRSDFQSGSNEALFHSVREKLFRLPDETLVHPCHDYQGRFVSSIAQEKTRNPRLGLEKSFEEFAHIMDNLNLPYPKKIDIAVPGNRMCGVCPPEVTEENYQACDYETGMQG